MTIGCVVSGVRCSVPAPCSLVSAMAIGCLSPCAPSVSEEAAAGRGWAASVDDEAKTMFRRWQSSSVDEEMEGPVPGLRPLLDETGLSSYMAAFESWCRRAGAAFLSELQDELDDVCDEVHLPEAKRRRLRHALDAQQSPSAATPAAKVDCVGALPPPSPAHTPRSVGTGWSPCAPGEMQWPQEEAGAREEVPAGAHTSWLSCTGDDSLTLAGPAAIAERAEAGDSAARLGDQNVQRADGEHAAPEGFKDHAEPPSGGRGDDVQGGVVSAPGVADAAANSRSEPCRPGHATCAWTAQIRW